MQYRIIEYTYETGKINYKVDTRAATNQEWQENSSSFDKEKDAEDWILARLAAVKDKIVTNRVVLPTVYE